MNLFFIQQYIVAQTSQFFDLNSKYSQLVTITLGKVATNVVHADS